MVYLATFRQSRLQYYDSRHSQIVQIGRGTREVKVFNRLKALG